MSAVGYACRCLPATEWDPAELCDECAADLPRTGGPAPEQPGVDRHGWIEDREPCTGVCTLCEAA